METSDLRVRGFFFSKEKTNDPFAKNLCYEGHCKTIKADKSNLSILLSAIDKSSIRIISRIFDIL